MIRFSNGSCDPCDKKIRCSSEVMLQGLCNCYDHNPELLKIDTALGQRIEHLQLQGFTEEQAAKMLNVPMEEVYKIYNQGKLFVHGNEGQHAVIASDK